MQSSFFNPSTSTLLDTSISSPSVTPSTNPLHLVFVDSRVRSALPITTQLPATQVVSLQRDRDGIAQINDVITQYSNLASVQIISHGAEGELLLGSTIWNQATSANQSTTLQSWAKHFSADADMLLYGCNVASNATGIDFIQSIAQFTGVDVAASNNLTGNAALGGDWDLEVTTGAIESANLLPADLLAQYQDTLDWYSNNFTDAGITNKIRTFAQDGRLSRTEMISLLREAGDGNTISRAELSDLRRVVSSLGYMMSDAVRVLSNKVVNSDPANSRSGIGNLYAGSSERQMERLINKWFLGGDRPTANGTYRYVSGSLFQNGIGAADVDQGNLGNCYFVATLTSIAFEKPNVIRNMFTDNGDGTFTVRFYNNRRTDYVTVDRYLPTDARGNAIYAGWGNGTNTSGSNELWVALLEKAYAQLNESGWIGRNNTNSYTGLNDGWMAPVMQHITGLNTSSYWANNMTKQQLINLSQSNVLLTVAFVNGAGFGIANDHAYSVTSYNWSTDKFHLHNPWGNSHVDITWQQLIELQAAVQWTNS